MLEKTWELQKKKMLISKNIIIMMKINLFFLLITGVLMERKNL
jgi:hypothetical protein